MGSGVGTGVVKYNQAGDNNFNAAPEVSTSVAALKADATISITGFSGVYDGMAHTGDGTAKGVNNANLTSSLTIGPSFVNYPGGTVNWFFAGGDNYNDTSGTVLVDISKAPLNINWEALTAITYGTTLSGKLNAIAKFNGTEVTGTYLYKQGTITVTPATILNAQPKPYNLSVEFTPSNSNYTFTSGTNSIVVQKANQIISWSDPDPIVYGTALSAVQLNATAAGTLSYTPDLGTILDGGQHSLSVSAAETSNYNASSASVTLTVAPAEATVIAIGGTFTYDGHEHAGSGSATGIGSPADELPVTLHYTGTPMAKR
ncbi:hypothetical protein PK28_01025 [Hymenobacter sp. DG25B]|nr:hypothetical protein PK28_01025 [Hymenobacter sp. DG25B]